MISVAGAAASAGYADDIPNTLRINLQKFAPAVQGPRRAAGPREGLGRLAAVVTRRRLLQALTRVSWA
jgi:hypothetical protein